MNSSVAAAWPLGAGPGVPPELIAAVAEDPDPPPPCPLTAVAKSATSVHEVPFQC